MTRYRFEEISWPAVRSGVCPVCGKRGKRRTTITNTVNPFNRNEDGTIRTRAEVRDVVRAKAAEWEREPFVHASCEEAES